MSDSKFTITSSLAFFQDKVNLPLLIWTDYYYRLPLAYQIC